MPMDRAERARLHRVVRSRACLVVEVSGRDPPEWAGFAMAARQADGAVTLAIYAREYREAGFPAASGGLAFDLLLTAAGEEEPVPAVLGEWYPSSDNFKEFSRLRSSGAATLLSSRLLGPTQRAAATGRWRHWKIGST